MEIRVTLSNKQIHSINRMLEKNVEPDAVALLKSVLRKKWYNDEEEIQLNEIRHWYNHFWTGKSSNMLLLIETKRLMKIDGYGYDTKKEKFYKL